MWGGASIVAEAVGLILGSTTSLDLQLGLVYSCRTTVGALAVALVEMLLPILAPPPNPASSLVRGVSAKTSTEEAGRGSILTCLWGDRLRLNP